MVHYGLDPTAVDRDTFAALARRLLEDFIPAFQPVRSKGGRPRMSENPGEERRNADLFLLVEAAQQKATKEGSPKTIPAICREIARSRRFKHLSANTLARLYYAARTEVQHHRALAAAQWMWRSTGTEPPEGFLSSEPTRKD